MGTSSASAQGEAAEGPPSFTIGGHTPELSLSVGDVLSIGASVRNEGGASAGLTVVAWGDALDRGLVSIERAQLVVGPPKAIRCFEAPMTRQGSDDGSVHAAPFADLEIPAGLREGPDAPSSPRARVERMYASNVHANLHGAVLAAGEGTLRMGFVPDGYRAGAFAYEMKVRVSASPRRPLRTLAGTPGQQLKTLEEPRTLFALVALAAPVETLAPLVAGWVERWAPAIEGGGHASLVTFPRDPDAKPKGGRVKAAKFFGGARWRSLRAGLGAVRETSVTFADDPVADDEGAMPLSRERGGFSFGTAPTLDESDDDPEVAMLGLWVDAEHAERVGARALLVALVDEAMAAGDGAQAIVGRWACSPIMASSPTPYEYACGLHGQLTSRRSWVTRHLRGVTDDAVWLGPALLGALGAEGRAALDAAATVTPVGRGVRAELTQGAGAPAVDALERALAPLLADAKTWQRELVRVRGY